LKKKIIQVAKEILMLEDKKAYLMENWENWLE
jgi:hypothetical protein